MVLRRTSLLIHNLVGCVGRDQLHAAAGHAGDWKDVSEPRPAGGRTGALDHREEFPEGYKGGVHLHSAGQGGAFLDKGYHILFWLYIYFKRVFLFVSCSHVFKVQEPLKEFFHANHLIVTVPPFFDQRSREDVYVSVFVRCGGKMSDPFSFCYQARPAGLVASPAEPRQTASVIKRTQVNSNREIKNPN